MINNINFESSCNFKKEKVTLTNAVVKAADPNRSGAGRSTRAAPSSTNLSDPPLLPKLINGITGIPMLLTV